MTKQFILIDGYTLVIAQSDSGVYFSGRHSRRALRYDDSSLIEFLARNAQDERFWRCFQARTVYEEGEERCFSMDAQQLIADHRWRLSQSYLNWAVWELIHAEPLAQSICLWHPGSYYRMFCIPYRTALKILQLVRDWMDGQQIQLEGVEVLSEAEWNSHFLSAARSSPSLLIPQILADLEQTASTYLLFFEDHACFYTPNQVEPIRFELLSQMSIAGLLNRKISAETRDRLSVYPNLQRCVLQAEQLWYSLDCTQAAIALGKTGLTLDWMFLHPSSPKSDFHKLCLQHFQQAQLQYPYTIPFEAYGKQYRLITGRLLNTVVLLTVLEIGTPTNASALFANVSQPTYLELVTWAAIESCLPPVADWEMAVDWRNREDELATLGTDPSLPKAEFFLNCLSSHLAMLWQNGNHAALKKGLASLQYHSPPETYFLYRRGEMLLSGKLRFNYSEWFDGGFLQLHRAEQAKRHS